MMKSMVSPPPSGQVNLSAETNEGAPEAPLSQVSSPVRRLSQSVSGSFVPRGRLLGRPGRRSTSRRARRSFRSSLSVSSASFMASRRPVVVRRDGEAEELAGRDLLDDLDARPVRDRICGDGLSVSTASTWPVEQRGDRVGPSGKPRTSLASGLVVGVVSRWCRPGCRRSRRPGRRPMRCPSRLGDDQRALRSVVRIREVDDRSRARRRDRRGGERRVSNWPLAVSRKIVSKPVSVILDLDAQLLGDRVHHLDVVAADVRRWPISNGGIRGVESDRERRPRRSSRGRAVAPRRWLRCRRSRRRRRSRPRIDGQRGEQPRAAPEPSLRIRVPLIASAPVKFALKPMRST